MILREEGVEGSESLDTQTTRVAALELVVSTDKDAFGVFLPNPGVENDGSVVLAKAMMNDASMQVKLEAYKLHSTSMRLAQA